MSRGRARVIQAIPRVRGGTADRDKIKAYLHTRIDTQVDQANREEVIGNIVKSTGGWKKVGKIMGADRALEVSSF